MWKTLITAGLVALSCGTASAYDPSSFGTKLPPTTTIPNCIQDQYGNQYRDLSFDLPHRIVTGVIVPYQCGSVWALSGSWDVNPEGRIILELTGANGQVASGCVNIYKLRGIYPASSWNYDTGYGAQEFRYAACGSTARLSSATGGMLGIK